MHRYSLLLTQRFLFWNDESTRYISALHPTSRAKIERWICVGGELAPPFYNFSQNGGAGCARTGRVGKHISNLTALCRPQCIAPRVATRIRSKGLHWQNAFVAPCGVSLRRRKPKTSFPSFSPFGGGVGGGAVQETGRKFLGLPARVRERGWGAFAGAWSVRFASAIPRTRRVRSVRNLC